MDNGNNSNDSQDNSSQDENKPTEMRGGSFGKVIQPRSEFEEEMANDANAQAQAQAVGEELAESTDMAISTDQSGPLSEATPWTENQEEHETPTAVEEYLNSETEDMPSQPDGPTETSNDNPETSNTDGGAIPSSVGEGPIDFQQPTVSEPANPEPALQPPSTLQQATPADLAASNLDRPNPTSGIENEASATAPLEMPPANLAEAAQTSSGIQQLPTEQAAAPVAATTPVAAISGAGIDKPPLPDTSGNTKKRWPKIVAIVVVLLIILASIGALAYRMEYNKPTNVIKEALANTLATKSLSLTGSLKAKVDNPAITYNVAANASYSTSGKFDANITGGSGNTKLSTEFLSPDGKNYYFQLKGLENLPEIMQGLGSTLASDPSTAMDLTMFMPMLSSINNKWVEISQDFLKQANGKGYSGSINLSPADTEELKQAYLDNSFIMLKSTLADQNVAGTPSFHYRVYIDNAKLASFLNQVNRYKISGLNFSDSQISGIQNNKNLSSQLVDIFISKGTRQFTGISLQHKLDGGTLNLSLQIGDYNKAVNVNAPKGAVQFEDLLMNGMVGSAAGLGDQPQSPAASFQTDITR